MSRAAATELLDTLEPLAYPQRTRQIAARASAADGDELTGLLEGLEEYGMYGRRVAVIVACAAQATVYLSARLAHPDPYIRGHAQRAAIARSSGISDDALWVALHDAPSAVRAQLTRTIVRGRRTQLADGLIDAVRVRWGDDEAARLLPGCGPETVARLLPELFHAVTAWTSLATRHPDVLLAEAGRQLDGLPHVLREQWWQRYGAGVARTAGDRPRRVLDLLEQYREGGLLTPEFKPRLVPLVAADAARTLRLLLRPGQVAELRRQGLPAPVLRRLVDADPPELEDLGRVLSGYPERFAELLHALPPGQRADFYDAVTDAEARAHGALHEDVLEALPHDRREEEARRMVQQARRRGAHWSKVLAAQAHLPDESAYAELTAATRRPSPEDRACAWPMLVRQAAHTAERHGGNRSVVTALIADMARLREEHESVRAAALGALADIPARLFEDEAVDHLDRVAGDALRATGSTHDSRAALGRLARSLLREHVAHSGQGLTGWALRTVVRLSGNTDDADLGRLDRRLPHGQEHAVHEALRYWLEAGAENDDHGLTFALARAVGRRAVGMPELQQLLWQAVQFGTEATARTAVELWMDNPATRGERAERVLAVDASAALLPSVSRTITMRRTDLLDPVLDATPPYGRFLSKESRRPHPPVGPWTARWLPRQQRAAAKLLAQEADDDANAMDVRREALRRLASIPGEGARELRLWANDPVEDESELADTALAATVRTERPEEAMPLLLEHARDGRARIAVPALARAFRYTDPWRLSDVLHRLLPAATAKSPESASRSHPPASAAASAPQPSASSAGSSPASSAASAASQGASAQDETAGAAASLTMRKAMVRLAADCLPLAEAAELLLNVYSFPSQHTDVKAVCVACAPGLLDDDRAWEIVESAAQGVPALRHALLRAHPLALPERHRERYARLITGLCHADDRGITEAVYQRLPDWALWAPDAPAVLSTAVTDLGNRGTWRQAAESLVELVIALPNTGRTLEQVLSGLIAADSAPDTPDARADRDRPARRRVEHIALTLGEQARRRPLARRHAGRTGVLLAQYEEFVPVAARLLCSAVTLENDAETLGRQMRGIAGLHVGRPGLAWRTAGELRRCLPAVHRPAETRERVLPVAKELADDGGTAAGLLAVTLAAAVNPASGWPEPWRELLRAIRRHDEPDVRAAALELATDAGE
ncbi:hypothetical protein [Streptomyces marispadix]|uniref:HEAT repeat domain-containing protein n=1 Tax=Streptomyces marispadix TaxID=2922868 RepID=A0ABS9T556_9ACTN|nr:hypothetical protein [Streptomyces marispadix]MCH6163588.1 hypothetical protein [Streptomyces marispadix]